MATKTITVTEEAYQSLKKLKSADESFSQLFMRLSKEKMKVKDVLGAVKISAASARRMLEYRKKASRDVLERRKDVYPG